MQLAYRWSVTYHRYAKWKTNWPIQRAHCSGPDSHGTGLDGQGTIECPTGLGQQPAIASTDRHPGGD
jgi:hypothetical protein